MKAGDRSRGCLLGLAVGDAVGTTLEFKQPGTFQPIDDMIGGGPFHLKPGQWTDDTSMALCLAESLVERNHFDAVDQMRRYVWWYRQGYLSSTGRCFDIGRTTREALELFERSGVPFCGPTDPRKAGNGSIMRLAPVPLYYADDPSTAIAMAGESSETTHGAPTAVDACRYLAALIVGSLQGVPKDELLSDHFAPVEGYWTAFQLVPEIEEIARGSFRRKEPPEIKGSGYVVQSLEAALWAFEKSRSFRDGCLMAANLGDDADTTAAVYGQLAGSYYGESGIPESWLEKLAMRDRIVSPAERLAVACRDRGQEWMRKHLPFDRCYWVVPGKLLAGYYPGDQNRLGTITKLAALLDTGIRAFVDLTEAKELKRRGIGLIPYEDDLIQIAGAKGIAGISYSHMPIPDLGVRAEEAMREVLDTIDRELENGRPVYVHCLGGIGRTGTVVGCWLARHGIVSGEGVLERIEELRRHDPSADAPSPETKQQRNLVRTWKAEE